MIKNIVFFLLFLFAISSTKMDAAYAENAAGAGMMRLELDDPLTSQPMSAVAFFPSDPHQQQTSIGPYTIAASRTAQIRGGRYPLILLSHGNLGSMWGHHGLATALASQGYIVVSLLHPGDNFEDASRVGKVSSVYGRPQQISAALSAALANGNLAQHIDQEKIGFVGFSAGGTTGLILAGARPDLALLERYCADRPAGPGLCEAQGRIEIDRPELQPIADPRIRSFALLAPVSVIFPAEQIEKVKAPVFIAVGQKDDELSPDLNAVALARTLRSNVQFKTIPQAGHFTFLTPCSTELSRVAPMLCTDGAGVDRVALHNGLNAEIAEFFHRKLGIVFE